MIWFNVPPHVGTEVEYISQAIAAQKICGDGMFTKRCSQWVEERMHTPRCLLTTSGTSALEMAALLCDIQPGDEVILPSYTFSSTANAFVLAGARLVFVDIRPDTMNLDENLLEAAISSRTRVICPVHYAGVSCEMDAITELAQDKGIRVVEDAAQGVMSLYKGRALGTLGDFGCFSFHETKNYSMGEGGAVLINDASKIESAEIMREKGTNRSKFLLGQVDKYTWVDYGSSYLPSDMNAAHLWAQLEQAEHINENRLASWNAYYEAFTPLAESERIELPYVPAHCTHNAHMFYIKLAHLEERSAYIEFMRSREILCVFHYVPLHSAPAGSRFGRFCGEDVYTTRESDRLVRLPMYYGLERSDLERVVAATYDFFKER